MPFDPFGIDEYHDKMRARIEAAEPGFAQTFIGDYLVSYEATSIRGPVYTFLPALSAPQLRTATLIEEIILDVAHGEGIASPRTFERTRIQRMVDDRLVYPITYPKMRRQADLLREFYLESGAEGRDYLL